MSLSDIIGFLATFGLFIYFMVRRAYEQYDRKSNPEKEKRRLENEDRDFQDFLRDQGLSEEDVPEELRPYHPQIKIVRPPPAPKPMTKPSSRPPPQPVFKTPVPVSSKIDHSYDIIVKEDYSKVEKLLQQTPNLKNMVIYHEIFGPPKALQDLDR